MQFTTYTFSFQVIYPIIHKVRFSWTQAYIMILAVWFVGFGFNFATNVPTAGLRYGGVCIPFVDYPNDTAAHGVAVLTFLMQYLAPLVLIVFIYISMAMKLRQKMGEISATGKRKNLVSVIALYNCDKLHKSIIIVVVQYEHFDNLNYHLYCLSLIYNDHT